MSDEKLTDEERITNERLGYLLGIFERKRWDLFQYADVQVSTEIALAELRARRQAALSEEEREALRWAAWMCCDGKKPTGGDYHEAVPLIRAALTRLVEQKR